VRGHGPRTQTKKNDYFLLPKTNPKIQNQIGQLRPLKLEPNPPKIYQTSMSKFLGNNKISSVVLSIINTSIKVTGSRETAATLVGKAINTRAHGVTSIVRFETKTTANVRVPSGSATRKATLSSIARGATIIVSLRVRVP